MLASQLPPAEPAADIKPMNTPDELTEDEPKSFIIEHYNGSWRANVQVRFDTHENAEQLGRQSLIEREGYSPENVRIVPCTLEHNFPRP